MKKTLSICFLTIPVFLAGCFSEGKNMDYHFSDMTTVMYECDGEMFFEERIGSTERYCQGDLVNVSCHLRIKDDEPLDFYHLEETDCEDLKEEHPEVFFD